MMVENKQNLLKIDKNERNVCLAELRELTHKTIRNRYINICFYPI